MRESLVHFEPDTGEGTPGGTGAEAEPPEGTDDDSQAGDASEEQVPAAKFKEVQNEAKNLRKRLRALEAQVATKDTEGQSEVEQLSTKLSETSENLGKAEARIRVLTVAARASKHGIVDGTVAAKLVDFDQIEDIEDMDEVDSALKALVKKHPFLTGKVAGGADGGEGTGRKTSGAFDMNSELRRLTGRQT